MKRALLVVPLTVLALGVLAGCGESDAHKQARDDAKVQADANCSIEEGLSRYSDAFARCVKEQTQQLLKDWEAAHPGA